MKQLRGPLGVGGDTAALEIEIAKIADGARIALFGRGLKPYDRLGVVLLDAFAELVIGAEGVLRAGMALLG